MFRYLHYKGRRSSKDARIKSIDNILSYIDGVYILNSDDRRMLLKKHESAFHRGEMRSRNTLLTVIVPIGIVGGNVRRFQRKDVNR